MAPVATPITQRTFFFSKAAIDESKIAICRKITAMPKIPECFWASSLMERLLKQDNSAIYPLVLLP
jgi:hypothetical protein